jgi:hypothetical protein
MGGRASEQWPSVVRHGAYGVLVPPPRPSTEVVEVQQADAPQPEIADTDHDEQHDHADTTITDIDGGINLLGRWWLRFWLRVAVHKRRS